MMAGATAVPLTPPEHKVLFQPTPETTPADIRLLLLLLCCLQTHHRAKA
jgi:hypothetical protein